MFVCRKFWKGELVRVNCVCKILWKRILLVKFWSRSILSNYGTLLEFLLKFLIVKIEFLLYWKILATWKVIVAPFLVFKFREELEWKGTACLWSTWHLVWTDTDILMNNDDLLLALNLIATGHIWWDSREETCLKKFKWEKISDIDIMGWFKRWKRIWSSALTRSNCKLTEKWRRVESSTLEGTWSYLNLGTDLSIRICWVAPIGVSFWFAGRSTLQLRLLVIKISSPYIE